MTLDLSSSFLKETSIGLGLSPFRPSLRTFNSGFFMSATTLVKFSVIFRSFPIDWSLVSPSSGRLKITMFFCLASLSLKLEQTSLTTSSCLLPVWLWFLSRNSCLISSMSDCILPNFESTSNLKFSKKSLHLVSISLSSLMHFIAFPRQPLQNHGKSALPPKLLYTLSLILRHLMHLLFSQYSHSTSLLFLSSNIALQLSHSHDFSLVSDSAIIPKVRMRDKECQQVQSSKDEEK